MKILPIMEAGNELEDIMITIPASTSMETYKEELARAEAGEVMNFKVSQLPTKSGAGKRCWLCYKDQIIGYMIIKGFSEKAFTCTTTGKRMQGKFIERTGKFHWLQQPIAYNGFRGFRYFTTELKKQLER